jgi:hypothetical protein
LVKDLSKRLEITNILLFASIVNNININVARRVWIEAHFHLFNLLGKLICDAAVGMCPWHCASQVFLSPQNTFDCRNRITVGEKFLLA